MLIIQIEREKGRILSDIGLSGRPADIRFLEVPEWNLLGNREGWGKTNTYEWTNTEFRLSDVSFRLFVGRSRKGGAGHVLPAHPGLSDDYIGFRAAVILGS
jgi:hypothetical protein